MLSKGIVCGIDAFRIYIVPVTFEPIMAKLRTKCNIFVNKLFVRMQNLAGLAHINIEFLLTFGDMHHKASFILILLNIHMDMMGSFQANCFQSNLLGLFYGDGFLAAGSEQGQRQHGNQQ